MKIPSSPLGIATVPALLVPTLLARTIFPVDVGSAISTPMTWLPEMTLF